MTRRAGTLDAAQEMSERARAHATSINVPMNIAVTDGGGHLLAFARMDGAILGSIEIALAKAKTSILFHAPARTCGSSASRPAPRQPRSTPTAGLSLMPAASH